jgi:hypothetical protein
MNSMRFAGVCAAAASALLAGCGGGESPEAFAAREELRARVAKTDRAVEELRGEIETMRAAQTTSLKATVQDMLRVELDGMISTTVQARVEAKIGDRAEIDRIFRESVADAFAQHEAQKKAADDARREEQRLAWEKARAQQEEQRWAQVAKDLSLNETQKEQLRGASQAIRQEFDAVMSEVRAGGQPPDMDAMRKQAADLKTKYEAALAQTLTGEQLEAFRKQDMSLRMLDGMVQGNRGPGMFMMGGGRSERVRGGDRGDRGP